MDTNPIVTLSEICQKRFGRNIETKVLDKVGADHSPTVTVSITLPNGNVYRAAGGNKRIAKRKAAEEALETENF